MRRPWSPPRTAGGWAAFAAIVTVAAAAGFLAGLLTLPAWFPALFIVLMLISLAVAVVG